MDLEKDSIDETAFDSIPLQTAFIVLQNRLKSSMKSSKFENSHILEKVMAEKKKVYFKNLRKYSEEEYSSLNSKRTSIQASSSPKGLESTSNSPKSKTWH